MKKTYVPKDNEIHKYSINLDYRDQSKRSSIKI